MRDESQPRLARRRASGDGPGVARAKQAVELARPESLAGGGQLPPGLLAVAGALDVAKDADRRRAGRALGEVGEGESLARVWLVRIVHEQCLLAHFRDLGHAGTPDRVANDAALAIRPEANRLVRTQADLVRLPTLAAHRLEGAVVEDVAVLVDLDERRRAAGDAVDAVGAHVVGEPARAADPGHEDDLLGRGPELGQELLDRGEDRVVAAAGAPPGLLVGGEVALRERRRRSVGAAGLRCFGARRAVRAAGAHRLLRSPFALVARAASRASITSSSSAENSGNPSTFV